MITSAPSDGGESVWVDPDLDFIRALNRQGGDSLKKCFQCGTCSATCGLSPDAAPFPRKEMAWCNWGMKRQLLADPDVWLCYQCNDCSTRCPRGAKPGDVLGAVRQECVAHYAVPGVLARWAAEPQSLPFLLAIPAAMLTLALIVRDPLAQALGISAGVGERIVYSYSNSFPHWLLNGLFGLVSLLSLGALAVGVARFWASMKAANDRDATPVKSFSASLLAALRKVFTHQDFATCEKSSARYWSHTLVFFGFLALCLVTIWVITSSVNPLIVGDFIYPFGFWSPWKLLANIGGVALVAGCLWMSAERMLNHEQSSSGAYSDWMLILALLAAALSGFATEALHYVRLEPHRHLVYFAHLVFVLAFVMYLPYSKIAHVFYRTAAMVYAEQFGRAETAPAVEPKGVEKEGKDNAGDDN